VSESRLTGRAVDLATAFIPLRGERRLEIRLLPEEVTERFKFLRKELQKHSSRRVSNADVVMYLLAKDNWL
jgi:hypothetical protein